MVCVFPYVRPIRLGSKAPVGRFFITGVSFILLSLLLPGDDRIITPEQEMTVNGIIMDMALWENRLAVATDSGEITLIDAENREIIMDWKLPPVKSFWGDEYPPRVFSVDFSPDGNDILITCEGSEGKRNLLVLQGKSVREVLPPDHGLFIIRAMFITGDRIVISLMSNEHILYNRQTRETEQTFQLSHSAFSHSAMNEDRSRMAVADESGEIHVVDTVSGEEVKVLSGGNVDRVYKVSFRKNKILTGGQDRRVILYDERDGTFSRIDNDFLVYAVALSFAGTRGAYMLDEYNRMAVFSTLDMEREYVLEGHNSIINTIIFEDENHIISSGDNNKIYFWSF